VSERIRENRLAGETSPYLLQHAHNPVDWYPWGEEALTRARDEDRPILLSIGYAACHWCHVMERESFEDEATAWLMNEHFVSIKVDREERPDLDGIYMDAVQAMTGSGGWPMTVFLAPDGTPFYAGTYFPPEDRHGLPSFRRVLEAVAEGWRDKREELSRQGDRVREALTRSSTMRGSDEPLTDAVLREAFDGLRQAFDPEWGGFGRAPKFPQPMTVEFLLRCHLRGFEGALEMVTATLDRMAAGGMYDQVGGGFHRYSTDGRWHVPHFEKMLYDNAQLARVYVRAWQVTGRERYRQVAEETLDYLLRELRHDGGAFFSSQDADSEGEEGTFFVWSWDQLVDVAGQEIARWHGARPEGNWEANKNVLWTPLPEDQAPPTDQLERARQRLFEVREQREKPATDDKVLAAWNGLAISALAEAGRVLDRPDYVQAAVRAAMFVLTSLRREDGRLLRSWRDGRASVSGYLDDYALMAEAALTLYQTTFDLEFFREARRLADEMIRLFQDPDAGGFFQTGVDAERLVVRPKELFDNAVPSGNSAAAEVLQRLALFTGEAKYERVGVSALRLVGDQVRRAPTGFGHALCGLDLYLSAAREVAILGDPGREDTRGLIREVHGRFLPNAVVAVGPPSDDGVSKEIALLRDREPRDGLATAFVCERFVCQAPVTDREALAGQLTG
jgi:uncharacterized protein YyaL (SSP411 family)